MQFSDIQKAQQGLTPDQLATQAQAATLPYTGNTMTPESLSPASLTPFTQPAATPIPDVANLFTTPPLTPTPEEQQAQGINDRLQTLNDQLIGKSAYQSQENTALGVDTASKTVTDLGSQLTNLKNEALAIPLQLQQNASERGITTTSLGRQENSRLRTNAIASLGVSSLMAAAQGQLATAQSFADKAVAAKFDPIQEQITALKSNLSIILNSPKYSLEQKNRAQAQLDIQNKKESQLNQQKTDASAVLKVATDAASNGADALTLQNISKANTPGEALQIATDAGVVVTGKTQGTLFTVPTAKELGGAQFYKYPNDSQVYTNKGVKVNLAQYKQLTGQQNTADAQVKFDGIKTVGTPAAASPGKTTTSTTTKLPSVPARQTEVSGYLKSQAGGDGYISPQVWAKALDAWVSSGYGTTASFKSTFANYKNPADPRDYK